MIKIKNKTLSKKASSEIVVVLIVIIIFSAVSYFVSKGLGDNTKSAGTSAGTQITSSVTDANKFSTTGSFK